MNCATLETALQLVFTGALIVLVSVVLLVARDFRRAMKGGK